MKNIIKLFLAAIFLMIDVPSLYAQQNLDKNKPYPGKFFVKRTSVIDSSQSNIYYLRPFDKKDVNDTTMEIKSLGEGWLDRDSIPVGHWIFYTREKNKEYVFKEGNYTRTNLKMFKYVGPNRLKELGYDPHEIIKSEYKEIRFIKSGIWKYYHSNGKLWKQIKYESTIPVECYYGQNDDNIHIYLKLNQLKTDEWIEGKVREYDTVGKLTKELFYIPFSEVVAKRIYNKNGKMVKEFNDFRNGVAPNNY